MEKISYIKRYYKGRDECATDIKIVDKGETVLIEDYDEQFIEILKKNVKVAIYGSFISDVYDVHFVDISKNNEYIGIPLAIGIEKYNNARRYAGLVRKALGYKWTEDILLIGHSAIDKGYIIK